MPDEAALADYARNLAVAARSSGLADVTVLATVTASLAAAHGLDVEFADRAALAGAPATVVDLACDLPEVPRHVSPALVLATAREALLAPEARRRHGAHYTPYAVARRLAAIALDRLPSRTDAAVCDPSVGGGVFLIALADELRARGVRPADVAGCLWGADIDPLSVVVARTALQLWAGGCVERLDSRVVHGDPLAGGRAVWPSRDGFDLVIGNPPFLNQLQRASSRTRVEARRLAERFGDAARGYVDASALFLLAGLDLAAPDGIVLLIQPQSCLSARDAERVRATIDEHARLEGLWFCRDRVFDASVRVCAPMIRAASRGDRPVDRWVDREVRPTTAASRTQARDGDWSSLTVDLLGVPAVAITPAATLSDIGCRATSGFRDQFYGFVAATHELADRPDAPLRLVTVGMIDPLGLAWGRRHARFARRDFIAPVVEAGELDERLAAWVDARRGPKLLVATQTKVVEVAVDEGGDCVPLTPVIELRPPDGWLWRVAAALTSPVATAIACRVGAGSALAIDAIKLSARQLLELPVPGDDARWQEGAELAMAIAQGAGDRARLWRALAETMCAAYGEPGEPLTGWWIGRLPKVALTPPAAPC
jgi:hypothetical protein